MKRWKRFVRWLRILWYGTYYVESRERFAAYLDSFDERYPRREDK